MDNSDKIKFKELMDGLTEYYQIKSPKLEKLSVIALQLYFGTVKSYSLEQVMEAASKHMGDAKRGMFFPVAADLIIQLEGGEITAEMIVAAAQLSETPLGCLARIHIGSWDLSGADAFFLRQRATECLQFLPDWKGRAARGEYSDHEISVMLKYKVSPTAPLAFGLAAPAINNELLARTKEIEQSPRHLRFIEPAYDAATDDSAAPLHPSVAKILESVKSGQGGADVNHKTSAGTKKRNDKAIHLVGCVRAVAGIERADPKRIDTTSIEAELKSRPIIERDSA